MPGPAQQPAGPPPAGAAPPPAPAQQPASKLPRVRGLSRYDAASLRRILTPCSALAEESARLQACAVALTTQFTADGYINSRVYVVADPPPAGLEVVEGRIAAVRVQGPDPRLNQRLLRLLLPLQRSVLQLPSLERVVRQLKRQNGVDNLEVSLNQLGGDISRAELVVNVTPRRRTLQGELSLRNDGTPGSGQFRGLATLLQNDLLRPGDGLLWYGEVNTDASPDLGYSLASLSYTLPLGERLRLSGAFGASRRNLIELSGVASELSYRQLQVLGQAEYRIATSLSSRWYGFAGLSANRTDSYLAGQSLPLLFGAGSEGWLRSGFLRLGLAGEGSGDGIEWSGSAYGLQGLAGFSSSEQLQAQQQLGIQAGQARAIGLQLNGSWRPAARWQLALQGGGQLALAPLTGPMGLSLGSDNGLRGLPGQVISGDSGLLGEAELSWSAWHNGQSEIQLVPFFGAGRVTTQTPGGSFSGTVGAAGLLVRWLQGRHWLMELGWVNQFESASVALPDDWLLNNGLYSKISFRF